MLRASSTAFLVILSLVDASSLRNLAEGLYDPIVGYTPRTQITDHAAIDLDQQAMEGRLGHGQLIFARNIYERGGYSKSVAALSLIDPRGPRSFPAGTTVWGRSHTGDRVISGFLNQSVSWGTGTVELDTIFVQYYVSDNQESYSECHVGGLYTFEGATLAGCTSSLSVELGRISVSDPFSGFADNGTVAIGDVEEEAERFEYTYLNDDIRPSNVNDRTLQGFSTLAREKMKACPGCDYYPDFNLFFEYYGMTDYADHWIQAAFFNRTTDFSRGNADFKYSKDGLSQAVQRGTVALSLYMFVIRELENAITDCEDGCIDGQCDATRTNSIDIAMSLYAGSLEGQTGSGDGVLMYSLADQRALDFRTAGPSGNHDAGTSWVNLELVKEFKRSQLAFKRRGCTALRGHKERIANLMKVPLVQSTLLYAYNREFDISTEETEAAGATFTAALLPYLHQCSPNDAQKIYENMAVGSGTVNFGQVKRLLQKHYGCLGVTCEQVGGLWTVDGYIPGAAPCSGKDSGGPTGPLTLLLVSASLVTVVLLSAYLRSRYLRQRRRMSSTSRNIAAVSNIS